jgi:hypothetical protein
MPLAQTDSETIAKARIMYSTLGRAQRVSVARHCLCLAACGAVAAIDEEAECSGPSPARRSAEGRQV